MKSKVKRFVLWIIPAVLLYLLCLFGWIPTITEYNSIDISAVSKAYILGFSIAAAIVFAFSVYYFMKIFIEKEGEKKKIIFAIILMMVYVVGIFLLKAKLFIAGFKSDKYLRQIRERTKAELGVAMSVFSPDRVFTTMNELLDSVQWGNFKASAEQFARVKEF